MSMYGTFPTELRDANHLCAALEALGLKHEVHAEPQTLYDYQGHKRPQKAEIIIRRGDTGLGASNDVGFARQADGTYQAIISEYDEGCKFNQQWLGQLKQEYKISRRMEVGKSRGYVFMGRETVQKENGKSEVLLRFGVR